MQILHLEHGSTRANIVPEAGGRLLQIEINDGSSWLPLLVAPTDLRALLDEPLAWGCYPMVPWPGRVGSSRFDWEGRTYELPANHGVHSIHGRGMYLPWRVTESVPDRASLAIDLGPKEGWPFAARAMQQLRVLNDGIELRMEVHAVTSTKFPAGLGWHPWFRRDVRPGLDPQVLVPAPGHYEARTDHVPTGVVAMPSGEADLRHGPPIGGRRLDDFYCGVTAPMQIRWGDLALTMTSSPNCTHAVVFTGSERGFCIEPQTCAPDAFNLAARGVGGSGLAIVEPGRPLVASTTWRWDLTSP